MSESFFNGNHIDKGHYISRYKKSWRLPMYSFKLKTKAIDECAAHWSNCNADLVKEDLVFADYSLQESIVKYEKDVLFMSEALLKTYPTKLLTKKVVKVLAEHFQIPHTIFTFALSESRQISPNEDIYEYDLENDDMKFTKATLFNTSNTSLMETVCYYVEKDVAGAIVYLLRLLDKKDMELQLVEELVHAGNAVGYDYVGSSIHPTKKYDFFEVKFESKMQETEIEVEDFLYHIAPMTRKDKILKYGLQPRHSNKPFKHSDRVYVFNGSKKEGIVEFLKQLSKMNMTNDTNLKSLQDCKDFAVFKIDRKKIGDLKLYRDNLFMSADRHNPTALYTYSNIKPNAIEFVGTYRINVN